MSWAVNHSQKLSVPISNTSAGVDTTSPGSSPPSSQRGIPIAITTAISAAEKTHTPLRGRVCVVSCDFFCVCMIRLQSRATTGTPSSDRYRSIRSISSSVSIDGSCPARRSSVSSSCRISYLPREHGFELSFPPGSGYPGRGLAASEHAGDVLIWPTFDDPQIQHCP